LTVDNQPLFHVVYFGPMWVKKYPVLYSSPCLPFLLSSSSSSPFPFSFGPSSPFTFFFCRFPITSICLLFFLCRFCSVHLVSKLIQPGTFHKKAEKRKTWLWPDVRIISCIIQIIRYIKRKRVVSSKFCVSVEILRLFWLCSFCNSDSPGHRFQYIRVKWNVQHERVSFIMQFSFPVQDHGVAGDPPCMHYVSLPVFIGQYMSKYLVAREGGQPGRE